MTTYIILRSGQGFWIDNEFMRNRSECLRVILPFGAYHFYDDRVSPGRQAEIFYSLFKDGQAKPTEIFCDWEKTYYGEFRGMKNVIAFMERVESLMNMRMDMYTGYYWFLDNTKNISAGQLAFFKARKLWLAAYTPNNTNTGIIFVKVPRPWKTMDIWQYGTPPIGHSYGVESIEIDMNERISEPVVPPDPPDPSKPNVLQLTGITPTGRIEFKEIR